MVNKGARKGDYKKKKEVKAISFFHNPNDAIVPDPVQQFDILSGVEREKKVRPADVFENYHKKPDTRKKDPAKNTNKNTKMVPAQVRGKKRGLDKKPPKKR
tara:strand:- start:33 stop:335 length:303 start_codon:yes stop_codon:yes gene_type:complete